MVGIIIFFLLFLVSCCKILLCRGNEKVKKLECQGIFIYNERTEVKNEREKEYLISDRIPYFIIYKSESGGIYNSNEHFNGLSIFLKEKVKNYEQGKEKVFTNFLYKIYYSSEVFSPQYYEVYTNGDLFTSVSSRQKENMMKLKKERENKFIERHIFVLKKNMNSLYVSSTSFDKLYEDCSFVDLTGMHILKGRIINGTGSSNGAYRMDGQRRASGKINKNCLSHKYILLEWLNESNLIVSNITLSKLTDNRKYLYEGKKDKAGAIYTEKEDEQYIWVFMYISKTDLMKAFFDYHLKLFFLRIVKRKNDNISMLFKFFLANNIIRNVFVKSFTEKREYNTNEKEKMRGKKNIYTSSSFNTKYVFHISFNMYTRNYKSVECLSFFFSKFHCYDKQNKNFFMNSFVNNTLYSYLEDTEEEVQYENNTYTNGMEKNLLLLAYIYSSVSSINKENCNKCVKRKINFSFFNYDIENFPLLFQDHLYSQEDFIIYKEKENKIISKKSIFNVLVHKEITSEGINKNAKTNVVVQMEKNSPIRNMSFLNNCKIVMIDLYSNNIIIDKEKVRNKLKLTFSDVENCKDKSSHIIAKYDGGNLINNVNHLHVFHRLYVRLSLHMSDIAHHYRCNSVNEEKASFDAPWKKEYIQYGSGQNGYIATGGDTDEEEEDIKGSRTRRNRRKYTNYLCGEHFAFSYDTLLSGRYVTPCHGEYLELDMKNDSEYECTDYDIVSISNAKPFLNCMHDKDNPIDKEAYKHGNFTIYADEQTVYIRDIENIVATHTADFYIYLQENAFYSLIYPKNAEIKKQTNNNDLDSMKNTPFEKKKRKKKKEKKEKEEEEDEPQPNDGHTSETDISLLKNFIYVKTINYCGKKHKIVNYNKIHANEKFKYNVLEANDIQKLNIPIYYSLLCTQKHYSDVIYVYSFPRGNDSYQFILYLSSLTSAFLILFTFYLSYKFA
ncbi:conserved Plasmodium protein, unknown function [Plasmodium malariae]|uniref:Uncharacterized protein n=1 Tax=Plasmodium malariae TaxID=5858 RepID=A0A1C3KC12_PLAMA|nr:conserved Plasmodium protein, unknown function [Plasmodium malariae]